METIKDFFKNINYRLSSPFIFSFVISWLFFNWQIPVSLFFYNHNLSQVECLQEYLDFIGKNINFCNSLLFPIFGALFYTFIYPYINKFIKDFHTEREVAAEKSELKIREGSSIPIDKYLSLRDSLVKKQQQLELIIKAESATQSNLENKINEVNTLSIENKEQRDRLGKAQIDLAKYEEMKKEFSEPENLESFFSGDWICEFFIDNGELTNDITFESFNIDNNKYVVKGKTEFKINYIQNVKFLNTLKFNKEPTAIPNKGNNIVTITKINDYLWVGLERLPGNIFSYVRYYPAIDKPKIFPKYINSKALNRLDRLSNEPILPKVNSIVEWFNSK